jgi:hypothetical protein
MSPNFLKIMQLIAEPLIEFYVKIFRLNLLAELPVQMGG